MKLLIKHNVITAFGDAAGHATWDVHPRVCILGGALLNCFKWNTFASRKNRVREREKQIYKISERVSSFFWDADGRPDFEEREGQQDMAFEILDALKKDQHILVEAGVGIGKSYAYLVPLLLYNHYTGKPAVIATSTIALQEQLLNDAAALQDCWKHNVRSYWPKDRRTISAGDGWTSIWLVRTRRWRTRCGS